jgi:hypothetical protein
MSTSGLIQSGFLKQILVLILRLLGMLLLLLPVVYELFQQWVNVRNSLAAVDWWQMARATGIQLVGFPLIGVIAWIVLRYLNARQPVLRVIGIYFVTQIPKYLPGGIWAFPSRVLAYQAIGVEKVSSVVGVTREVLALFLGAAVLSLLGLTHGLPVPDWIRAAIALGIGGSVMVLILTQIPQFWRAMSRRSFLKSAKLDILMSQHLPFHINWFIRALLVSITFWSIVGLGFRQIISAVVPGDISLSWFQSTSIFTLAWAAGFVIVFAPAGLGVREVALAYMLSRILPAGDALSITLLSRLWWTLTETVYILIALLWFSAPAERTLMAKLKMMGQKPKTDNVCG